MITYTLKLVNEKGYSSVKTAEILPRNDEYIILKGQHGDIIRIFVCKVEHHTYKDPTEIIIWGKVIP